MARAWILQGNPKVWDVWSWWEDDDDELDGWTIARHLNDIGAGDSFALWVSGPQAGVYAVGRISSDPSGPLKVDGGRWLVPPKQFVYGVDLETTAYLFERPVLKEELAEDPDFQDALVLRMPGAANPIPLTEQQWRAIQRRVGRRRQAHRPGPGEIVVTSRRVGEAPEDITVPTKAQEQRRAFREAQLVKRYEKHLRRRLLQRSVLLPDGERLVCDAYDEQENLLIEAKSSASRQDVRMAIGQLFDYRRHVARKAGLALLLPERPSEDLLELARGLKIMVIHADGGGFARL
jgi:hypothetical protein